MGSLEKKQPCGGTVDIRDNGWSCFCLSLPATHHSTLPQEIDLRALPENISTAPDTAFYVPLSSKASVHHLQISPIKSAGTGALTLPTQMF